MYNPFNKDLKDVKEDDLQILCNVSEGWYIEYKNELPKPKDIAKSIASFSNSRGGLYILGVKGNKTNNCADEISGVKTNQDIIHDSVRDNITPFPYFESYSVSLRNEKEVIIVSVDEGQETPYIHNDGRIYRRQSSSSDPIPENNRFTIDELYKKSREYQEKLVKFRTIDYGSCRGEEDWSYLIGYVNTKHFDKSVITDFNDSVFAKKILNFFNQEIKIEEKIGKIYSKAQFNNITVFSDSLIIRNLTNFNIAYNTLTIELFKNGSMKFMLPIRTHRLMDFSYGNQINQYLLKHNISESSDIIKFVSFYELISPLFDIFIKYFKFIDLYNCFDELEIVFEGNNVWRICLIADVDAYIEYINNFSLPIIIKNNIIYPDKPCKISYTNDNNKGHSFLEMIIFIIGQILIGFGIPLFEASNLLSLELAKNSIIASR
jgi:hypothetical protein